VDFSQGQAYLESLARFGSKPGLSRIQELCQALDNPQRNFPVIHIAGTNGKGSTARMTADILAAHGLKTGLYISPHIESFNERITVQGVPIPSGALDALVEELRPLATGMADHPTEFEVCTALAFQYFAQEAVDCAVGEVGMGGRFDATNVVQPAVCVITHVDLDHQEVLGKTIEEIAFEKAGIIKPGVPVVLTPQREGARNTILAVAEERGCHVEELDASAWTVEEVSLAGTVFTFQGQRIHLSLLGQHQVINACAAITASKLFLGEAFHWEPVLQSLGRVRWPGRLEVMGTDPLVLLDGAHNLDGAQALRAALSALLPERKITFLMGMMEDKEANAILKTLLPLGTKAIFTEPTKGRSASIPAAELKSLARRYLDEVYAYLDPAVALSEALNMVAGDEVLCICGSLYLVRELRPLLSRN